MIDKDILEINQKLDLIIENQKLILQKLNVSNQKIEEKTIDKSSPEYKARIKRISEMLDRKYGTNYKKGKK